MEILREYLEYGMYRTLAYNASKSLDTRVAIFIGLCIAFFLLGFLCKKLSGWMQKALFIAGGSAIIIWFWDIVYKNFSILALAILIYIIAAAFLYFRLYKIKAILISFAVILLIPNLVYAFFWAKNSIWAAKKPNIVWIMVDALRPDHLGCYGYKRNTSPNIDALAKGSILFEDAYSQATVTSLSVPSFFRGRYPQAINEGVPLGKLLEDRGYDTASIVGSYRCTSNQPIIDAVKQNYFDTSPASFEVNSDYILKRTNEWLEQKSKQPFFMFLLFMDAHSPYRKHKGFDFGDKEFAECPDQLDAGKLKPISIVPQSKDFIRRLQLLYDSGIGFTDKYIGELFAELKKQGLYDNTIIIFLADHGEEFAEHGKFFHANSLYKEVLHVPLIVKLPGQTKGIRVHGNFPLIDLYPSIINSIGIKTCKKLQGHSQELKSNMKIRDNYIFSAIKDRVIANYRSVISGNLHLIENMTNKKIELYDFGKDPAEARNIAKNEPEITKSLFKILINKEKELNKNSKQNSMSASDYEKTLSKKSKERLRSLGYLQ